MRRYVLFILLLVAATLCLHAQVTMQHMRGLTREQIDSLVHPTVAPTAGRVLRVDTASYDLGTLSETDVPVSRTFIIYNISKRPVQISRVRTTCGCTAARFDTASIAPGGATRITLTYNPKNRPGTIDVDGFVYLAGNDKQPMARLSLYGEVVDGDVWSYLPYTMGALRIKHIEVNLTELPANGKPSIRIPCANSGNTPLRLSSRLLPPYASFRTEPEVIAPNEEADIVVTVDVAKVPKREGTQTFSVLIDGLNCRPSERTLHVVLGKQ